MKTNELVSVNASEFGLTEETAKNISQQFQPMLDKMVELENEFNEIISLPLEDIETIKKAKELRLKFVKVRTGTAEIHKTQKAFYLNGGRFVDGWKNAQLFASQSKEEKLEEIEKHFENVEKSRIETLNNVRVELIRPYVEDTTILNLGTMEVDVWDAYFTAKKKGYEDKIKAEQEAEEKRISDAKIEAERLEAQRLENEKLKLEAEQKEAELQKERLENEAKLKAIQDEADKKALEEKVKQDAILKAEQEAKAKIEAELKAKKDAELKAENERLEAEDRAKKEAEKLAKAPVKKQISEWVNLFSIPVRTIDNEIALEIELKFESFKKWAKLEIEKL